MRHFFAVLALSTLVACGKEAPTPTVHTLAGNWSLSLHNGKAVPYVTTVDGETLEVLRGALVLTPTGLYNTEVIVRRTRGGVSTNDAASDAGGYTVNGNVIVFSPLRAHLAQVTARLSGKSITIGNPGTAVVFTKS